MPKIFKSILLEIFFSCSIIGRDKPAVCNIIFGLYFNKDFFNENELIFYKDIYDLSYKINKYKRDKKQRKLIAKKGKEKYFKYFNSSIVAEYIIKKTIDSKSSKKFLWAK